MQRLWPLHVGEIMSGINILHLSDLHISSKRLSATSRKLIQDIVAQTIDMDDILLVISGDIVDKVGTIMSTHS